MKKIGPTVREIRKIKGLTSLEVYSGIISKSFASRFENGINEIGSEKLFMVLNNLSMSADEFRFIQNDYHQSKSQELRHQLDAAYDVHNLQEMGKIINENKNSSQPNFRSIAVTGQILLDALDCFLEQGIETTSIEMIRAKSESSVGAIYHHFKNKEGIVAALFFQL